MECVIVAGNVRLFGKAVHTLAKIGIDLYIEALNEGVNPQACVRMTSGEFMDSRRTAIAMSRDSHLVKCHVTISQNNRRSPFLSQLSIRIVNLSRTTYASFTFRTTFFQSYNNGLFPGESETIRCIVDAKACFAIFKSLPTIEKCVEKCTLTMDMYSNKFRIQLSCTHDATQSYELVSIESDPLCAVFSKTNCCNYIASFPKILGNAFQSFQDEVIMTTTSNIITLENYIEKGQKAPIKVMHTKLHMEPDEFQVYNVKRETRITFSSKDLKVALSFSEITDQPISIHFDGPGKPIVIVVTVADQIEADFVLATLDGPPPVEDSPSNQTTTTATSPEHSIIRKAREQSRRICEEATKASPESPATVVQKTTVAEISNGARRESERLPSHSSAIQTAPVEHSSRSIVMPTENVVVSPPHKRTKSVFMAHSPVTFNSEEVVLACDTDDDETF